MSNTFLKAEWRKLVMANYAIDPKVLLPYLPKGTELDLWNGRCYVSLIGFMFLNTKLKGIKIPFHSNFEEVNLRFYVRHKAGDEWRRGAVFIKEIVPLPTISIVANTIYGEHYETMKMQHSWDITSDKMVINYQWKKNHKWNSIEITTDTNKIKIDEGSEEEFITEHYWGYTKLSDNKTSEYGVEHPRWYVYKTLDYKIDCNFESIYGSEFTFLNKEKPISVFLAEGSDIEVKDGRKLDHLN
jgi:uncharacterized protein